MQQVYPPSMQESAPKEPKKRWDKTQVLVAVLGLIGVIITASCGLFAAVVPLVHNASPTPTPIVTSAPANSQEPTQQPGSSIPTLRPAYSGFVLNENGSQGALTFVLQSESQQGQFTATGTNGSCSAAMTGNVSANQAIVFELRDVCGVVAELRGSVAANGSMSGDWTANTGFQGTWSLNPTS